MGPGSTVSLSSILYTDELYRRPSRTPDNAKEKNALTALARALADSPGTILQKLTETILEVVQAGSAGISLLTKADSAERFYWPAIAGKWKSYIGGGTPREFGPCGDVLDHNTPLLLRHIERRYTYFKPVRPAVREALLVPFYVDGKAVGTIWVIAHNKRRKFDAEDERLMISFGKFASSAYQVTASIGDLKSRLTGTTKPGDALQNSESHLHALTRGLKSQVRFRTRQLEERNSEILLQTEQLRELSSRLFRTQDEERRRIARELHDSAGQIVMALGMNLSSISLRLKRNAVVKKSINESLDLIHQLSTEIRTMSYLLHPPLLDETGLSGAIQWYVQGLTERSGLSIELEIPENFGRLSSEMEMAMFRILQECLTNIHRHSGSKTAAIRLARFTNQVSLEIQDTGTGMSAEKLAGIKAQRSGVGITGIRERVRQLKGILDIQSNPRGTKVAVLLPVAASPEFGENRQSSLVD